MPFLFEKINVLRENGSDLEVPQFIIDNLNSKKPLRDYQIDAYKNFALYLKSTYAKNKQTHVLFHMATGSGKTMIMAMLILHYFNEGYRNFLFFTHRSNIVAKTIVNFCEAKSNKYLFNEKFSMHGIPFKIKKVDNTQQKCGKVYCKHAKINCHNIDICRRCLV